MNVDKIIDIEFKENYVELKILINDGEKSGEIDNFYLTRIITYRQWKTLASKLKMSIKYYEDNLKDS
tara:strand:+ start:4697 stop:4897 length:201 start_codon:yes stop_codon:yes gene_type:complete